jgi:hypothetical protein
MHIYIYLFIYLFICIHMLFMHKYIYIWSAPPKPGRLLQGQKFPEKCLDSVRSWGHVSDILVCQKLWKQTMPDTWGTSKSLGWICFANLESWTSVKPISIEPTMSLVGKLQPFQWCCMFGNDNSCFQSDLAKTMILAFWKTKLHMRYKYCQIMLCRVSSQYALILW